MAAANNQHQPEGYKYDPIAFAYRQAKGLVDFIYDDVLAAVVWCARSLAPTTLHACKMCRTAQPLCAPQLYTAPARLALSTPGVSRRCPNTGTPHAPQAFPAEAVCAAEPAG